MTSRSVLLIALGISLTIHLVVAAHYYLSPTLEKQNHRKARVEISLLSPAIPPNSTAATQESTEPVKQESALSQPAPAIKKTTVNSTPTPQKNIPQKEQPKKIKQYKTPVIDEPETEETEHEQAPSRQSLQQETQFTAEKINYLGKISEHINKFKFFPQSAQRRGIEGQVNVSFDLNSDGSITNLHTDGKHSVLVKASQQSIEQALPMPERNEELYSLETIHVEFSMKYFLKNQ